MPAKTKYDNRLVSVITPVYNAESFLSETIESVLKQTYKDFEIILVDDRSRDRSKEIILDYAEKYDCIKPIFFEKNMGVSSARNLGIQNARGRYIAFLDSDDLWTEDKLQKQLEFMDKNNYHFTYTGYRFMDFEGNLMEGVIHPKKMVDYSELLKYNDIPCLAVVIDRNYIDNIEMPSIRHEDYACWLGILKEGHKAYGLNEVLAYYRTRPNSLSGNKVKAAGWTWNILRNQEKLPFPKALYYFSIYAYVNIKKYIFKKR